MAGDAGLGTAEIRRILEERRADLERLGVASLFVFGSVARGEATPSSDVDFLVEFRESATLAKYMDLKELLERALARRIDLVTRKALRPRVQRTIEKDAVRVA